MLSWQGHILSKVIIITGLLPIFSFQKVEGKMFSPLAYTLGFALLGALITTLTLVPVLISILLKKNVHEKHNPFVHYLTGFMLWDLRAFKHKRNRSHCFYHCHGHRHLFF